MSFSVEAQAYLAAIVTSSDDAIISKDLNGNITSWNLAAERIFGYTAEEATGKHISLIIPPEHIAQKDDVLAQIREGKRVEHFEAVHRTKNGKTITLSVSISPIIDSKGVVIGAAQIARNIMGSKEAERAAAHLSSIVESSDDAIISKDLNGFILSWNKAAARIFGYTAEEVVGRHITLIIPAEHLAEEDKILATLRKGERIEHFETVRRHKDGHLIPVSLTVSPVRSTSGKIIGASKIARNISEKVNAENAIREMGIKKDEFLANMSHELRTPMNAVIGLSNLLMTVELPAKARKFVETLKSSADNLLELINDLLDFAKIDSQSLELEEVEFSLAEQLEKVLSVLHVRVREKNLAFHVHFSPVLNRYFLGDPLRIQQILTNLISNAVKFTDKGSIEVDIGGTPDEANETMRLVIKVSDTGIGIPQGKLEGIFDKFTQADSSITRKYGGSGLGLAIVKAIVEKLNGTISVSSQEGLGATFRVELPLKMTSRVSPIESFSLNALPEAPVTRKNILLVEDYEPNIVVAEAMLQHMGYNYDIARNGVEALRHYVNGEYDVILMDLQMHELDGLEATRRIRKIEAERNEPRTFIIAMTAHVREQDKSKCLEAGMDDFIAKPFNPATLAQKIASYIDRRKKPSAVTSKVEAMRKIK